MQVFDEYGRAQQHTHTHRHMKNCAIYQFKRGEPRTYSTVVWFVSFCLISIRCILARYNNWTKPNVLMCCFCCCYWILNSKYSILNWKVLKWNRKQYSKQQPHEFASTLECFVVFEMPIENEVFFVQYFIQQHSLIKCEEKNIAWLWNDVE